MIRTFQGIKPTIAKSAFIEETAVVIGDVVIGEESSIWFRAVVRGDVNYIRIATARTSRTSACCTSHTIPRHSSSATR